MLFIQMHSHNNAHIKYTILLILLTKHTSFRIRLMFIFLYRHGYIVFWLCLSICTYAICPPVFEMTINRYSFICMQYYISLYYIRIAHGRRTPNPNPNPKPFRVHFMPWGSKVLMRILCDILWPQNECYFIQSQPYRTNSEESEWDSEAYEESKTVCNLLYFILRMSNWHCFVSLSYCIHSMVYSKCKWEYEPMDFSDIYLVAYITNSIDLQTWPFVFVKLQPYFHLRFQRLLNDINKVVSVYKPFKLIDSLVIEWNVSI